MTAAVAWDEPLLAAKVLRERRDGCSEVALHVDALADLRMIVLLEKRLHALPGVRRVSMDPASRTVRVVWQRNQTRLCAMLDTMAAMGCPAQPLRREAIDDARSPAMHDALKRLLVAGMCAMQVMTYAFVTYLGVVDFVDFSTRGFFNWMGFLLSIPVVAYSAHPFAQGMLRELRARTLGLNTPVALSVWIIFLASAWNTWRGQGEVYFDSVTMFVFLVLAGRFLELRAMHQGRARTEALQTRTPLLARRRDAGGTLSWVPAENLGVGDVVWLEGQATLPADGMLRAGSLRLDVSALTGESQPVACGPGERALAGSTVVSGQGEFVVERPGSESFATRLAQLSHRSATASASDVAADPRLSRFVVWVLLITVLTALAWLSIEPARAWSTAVAVLVVACPCAYALTRPSMTMGAQLALARRGVLMTHGQALLRLPMIDLACFDKTGTLTAPRLHAVHATAIDAQRAGQLAAALARAARHPLSEALLAASAGEHRFQAAMTHELPGQGITGLVDGERYWLGRPDAFGHAANGSGALCLGNAQGVLAQFEFDDGMRDGAHELIASLRSQGIACEILSGDVPVRVSAVAHALGVDAWHATQSPEAKRTRIAAAQAQGAVVMLVGDGSNDAPALTQADVSASLATGTELAQASADLLLVSGRLDGLLQALAVAGACQARLDQGQRWSLLYNLCCIPLAAIGLVTPWLAALGMAFSSLVIVWRARGLHVQKLPR